MILTQFVLRQFFEHLFLPALFVIYGAKIYRYHVDRKEALTGLWHNLVLHPLQVILIGTFLVIVNGGMWEIQQSFFHFLDPVIPNEALIFLMWLGVIFVPALILGNLFSKNKWIYLVFFGYIGSYRFIYNNFLMFEWLQNLISLDYFNTSLIAFVKLHFISFVLAFPLTYIFYKTTHNIIKKWVIENKNRKLS